MKPKKHLGQNFLTSIPARIAIIEAGKVIPTDTVLEVGPGKGFLTRGLLDTGATIIALEKDRDLLPILASAFSTYTNLTVHEGDVLTFDPLQYNLQANAYKLIANIPYYITGAIFEHFLTNANQPSTMVVLIQKEVAERIVARDGKESILSLSIKAYGDPKLVYRVNKGSFNPVPTVDSAVLAIYNISRNHFKNQYHEALFFKLVKAGFAHKRKLLTSNIKEVFPTVNFVELFEKLDIKEKVRAEDLPLTAWLALSLHLSSHTSS